MEPVTLAILMLLTASLGVAAFVCLHFQGDPGDNWRRFKGFVSDIPRRVRAQIQALFRS